MHYVIIGTGPAGVTAAETLRAKDPEGRITLIGAEPEPPYSRMAIPYYLIDKIGEQGTYLRKQENYYQHLRIEIQQAQVSALDTDGKTLTLADGQSLGYDKLLIATGATPVRAPIDGIDLPQVRTCWTLEDARHIIAAAQPGAKVVLMGAGFIGCIILEALALRGVDLTVVEMGDRMVPRMMNDKAGNLLKSWCEKQGVRVLTSTRVEGIRGDGALSENAANGSIIDQVRGLVGRLLNGNGGQAGEGQAPSGSGRVSVVLDSGEALEADLVISATGVRPNVAFLQGSGIEVDQGIIVDEFMHTSAEGVYAAGDVAQGRDLSTGEFHVQAIQPTAVEHGKLAAKNMAQGHESRHWGSVNMNVLDTLGLISSSFGLWMGVEGGDSVERYAPEQYKYLNLQFQGDVLVGASCVGTTEHIGVLRGLIQGKVPLGAYKAKLIQDPTQLMPAYLATAQGAVVRTPT